MAIRSPRRRLALFARLPILLLFGLLAAPAVQAQLLTLRQLSLAPDSATAGGSISVGGDRLRNGSTYTVVLVAGRDRHTLATVTNGDGSFQRQVVVPALTVGTYTVELLVDGAVVDSRSLKVLSPLALTVSNASPAAGSTVGFSVSGLTEGSLSLVYAGKVAFGPVNTAGGSLSGKFVVPTDRPASLPANVMLEARNATGKLVPRVGSRSLSVQVADTRPLSRISLATPSTTTPTPRQRFSYTGSVATNEMQASQVAVDYFWQAADGSVQPMGAPIGAVQADGSFSYTMRTPQLGTMSAGSASGGGKVIAVTRVTDANGLVQQQSKVLDSLITGPDTDGAIDLNITLTGSDGLKIEGARVDLVDADIDDLYDSNDNTGGVRLDGSLVAGYQTQFNGSQLADEALGCPANLERQYTDVNGHVEFEFDLGVSQGGVNIDGSGPPPQVTIQPSEDCVRGGSINDPTFCREVDPAGVKFSAVIRAAFLGYGYTTTTSLANGTSTVKEVPVRLDVRVDRYTGQVDVNTCTPQLPAPCPSCAVAYACSEQTFQRSANKFINLPKLSMQGLALGDPYFTNNSGHKLQYEFPSNAGTDPVKYKPVSDLTPLQGSATFVPASESWTIEFQYNPGAGRGLDPNAVTFRMPGQAGVEKVVTLSRKSGAASCSGEGGAEVWHATLPEDLARALRFPRSVYGSNPFRTLVKGRLHAVDLDGRPGEREVWFRFAALGSSLAGLAGNSGVRVETAKPHARRISLEPAVETADTEGRAVAEYNLAKQTNRVNGNAAYQLCVPASSNCGASSSTEFAHAQFSRSPNVQPPGGHVSGSDTTTTGTGTAGNRWVSLFDKTIPIFRWYWGIPELLSAEVFADLVLRAEYMLEMIFNASSPGASRASAGGRLEIGIFIGVDIDVLFGILIDAGAGIYGAAVSQLVTTTSLDEGASVDECLRFRMDFSGWLEIGCPIPNPFDPTCYIPDIEETYNIINESIGSCASGKQAAGMLAGTANALRAGSLLPAVLAGTPLTLPKTHPSTPPVEPMPAGTREALNRHPAIAIDGNGTRLVLSLEAIDKRMRLVSRRGLLRSFESTTSVISEGYGIRDTAVTFFGTDQAVAVWAESALPQGNQGIARPHEAARHQRLRYAVWDGRSWTAPLDLTTAGFGDGSVRLARCKPSALALRSDCATRKATVVFQRNLDRTIGGRKGIYAADFDGVGFSPIVRVDQSGSYNITPALAYQGGKPVVAWVRHDPGSTLDDVGNRRIALRRLDGSAEELDLGLPTRVAQPTLAAVADGQLAIGFTRAAATDAFIGTRQAVHLGQRKCSTGCRFASWRVQDQHGRALYGERPTLAISGAGEAVLTFRGLAYGGVPGAASPEDNVFPGDAPGMLATTGELLQLRSPLSNVQVPVHALSNDGAWHARPTAALDPSSGEVVALSISVPIAAQFAAKHRGDSVAPKLLASTKALGDGLHLAALPDLPDLAVDRLESAATRLTPGAPIAVNVDVLNRGSAWTSDETRSARLRLWWDTPQTRTTIAGEWPINSLTAAGRQTFAVNVPVPVVFGSDERQALRAEIVVEGGEGELDGENNLATLAIGGMPVPDGLLAVSEPGTRFVNLAWANPADDRVAGYRVYAEAPDGSWQPIGSSFNLGFADLAAQYGRSRSYRVASYSARGIESELSAVVTAEPAQVPKAVGIFSDGFE